MFALEPIGLVKKVKGEAFDIKRDNTTIPLKVGDKIYEGDTIKTSMKSSIGIIFEDGTLISVGSNSVFGVDEYLFEPKDKKVKFNSNLTKGTMACMSGLIAKINPDAMKIKAKSASMGIRGTYFIVEVDE
jgi:hypothetical protein